MEKAKGFAQVINGKVHGDEDKVSFCFDFLLPHEVDQPLIVSSIVFADFHPIRFYLFPLPVPTDLLARSSQEKQS